MKNIIKKVIAILLAVASLTALCSCSVNEVDENNEEDTSFSIESLFQQEIDCFADIEDYIVYPYSKSVFLLTTGTDGNATPHIYFPEDYERKDGKFTLNRKSDEGDELYVIYKDETIGEISYYIPYETENVSQGDIFEVHASITMDLEEYEYLNEDFYQTITVPELARYATVNEIKSVNLDELEVNANQMTSITTEVEYEFVESYLASLNIDTESYRENFLVVVAKTSSSNKYCLLQFSIVINPDGTIGFETFGEYPYESETIEGLLEENEYFYSYYTLEKIS